MGSSHEQPQAFQTVLGRGKGKTHLVQHVTALFSYSFVCLFLTEDKSWFYFVTVFVMKGKSPFYAATVFVMEGRVLYSCSVCYECES